MSLIRSAAFLILEAILVSVISSSLDSIKAFIVNKFSSQNIPPNDGVAIVGIAAIIIFIVIAYYLILQFRSYLKSKKAKETVQANLDILLNDIQDFVKKWRVTRFLRPSYRREIQQKSMRDSRFMVRNHANAIRSSIKSVKVLVNPNDNLFTSLDECVNTMMNLGLDLEHVFGTVASLKQTSELKLNEMVYTGDNICVKFRNIISELEELRAKIP